MSKRPLLLPHARRGAAFVVALVFIVAMTMLAGCPRRAPNGEHGRATVGPASAGASQDPAAQDGGLRATARVPAFRFVDQHGQSVTPAELAGHVWIFGFLYTSCTTVCPSLAAKLVMLERKLADPELRFVSFSVDPAHDTPATLSAYGERFRPGEQRWLLLSTDPKGLESFTRALGVAVQATGDADNPVRHSAAFFLVDRDGSVKGSYDSADPSALIRLYADAAALTHAARTATGETGEHLLDSLGCNGCHRNAELAPPLGVHGKTVRLADGRLVLRDEAYLREAILAPGATLVRGFPDRMPPYGSELSGPELGALVDYLSKAQAAPTSTDPTTRNAEAPTLARDPVCGMDVRVLPRTPHIDVNGRRYFFCSDACREKFEQAPAKFLH